MIKCAVCQSEDWAEIDKILVPCHQCRQNGAKPDCPQCGGKSKVEVTLRDRDFWFSQGYLYKEKIGFRVCKTCGYLGYAERWPEKEWRKKVGRGPINERVILAHQKRANSFKSFVFKNGCQDERILDFGCGLGYGHSGIIKNLTYFGYDNNSNYLKFAEQENGIIPVDLDFNDLVDLIALPYSLSFELNPRELLEKFRGMLNPSGKLYLEIPILGGDLHDISGHGATVFELAYHPNFYNCFTRTSIENLLKVTGWKIVKEEMSLNGSRFLCEPSEPNSDFLKEDYQKIITVLLRQSQSVNLVNRGMTLGHEIAKRSEAIDLLNKAITVYPGNLEAWLGLSVQMDYYQNAEKCFKLFKDADKNVLHKERLYLHFANIFKNWGEPGKETSWIKLAEELYLKVLEINPISIDALSGLLYLYAIIRTDKERMDSLCSKILELSPDSWNKIINIKTMFYTLKFGKSGE